MYGYVFVNIVQGVHQTHNSTIPCLAQRFLPRFKASWPTPLSYYKSFNLDLDRFGVE